MFSKNQSLPETRQTKILELLQNQESISITKLVEKLGVSEMTVRRDLNKLQRTGQLCRTHGGAIPTEQMYFQFDFASRRAANRKLKQAIAREAIKLITTGQKIILDTGTTTLELAFLLKNYNNLTVITPSLAVASVLQFSPGVETILLGGAIRRGSIDLTGIVTERILDLFVVDIAFQGINGIGLDGIFYNEDLRIARVYQEIRKHAEKAYILADSTKIGKINLVKSGNISSVDALITDEKITPEQHQALIKSGANLIIAKTA